jgi:CRP/FNR family transcriptional regulator/CRP/FNR family cyclic AMP-dependent transcriptional regulator
VDGSVTVEISPRKRGRLRPGDFFGEMSLLDGEPRSATVRAETDVRLLVIQRRNFQSLLREVPELSHRVLETLSRRIRLLEKSLNN